MNAYVNPYTGQTISPSQVGYESLALNSTTGSLTLQWPVNGNSSSVVANIIDVTTTSTAYGLILPSAEAVSPGQSFLVNNKGSVTVTIFAQDGVTTIGTVPASQALYFWLIDNTTLNGTWENVTFGAGTSAANAASLVGNGLSATGSLLNTVTEVSQTSSNYTFKTTDQASLYVWTGGAGTFTLPSCQTVGDGWYVAIKNDGTGILTINPVGTNAIDISYSTFQLQLADSIIFATDGLNWFTYGYGQSTQFVFTQLYLTGTGGTTTLTSAQAANIIQEYAGTLTSNWTIILPQTVQLYSLRNLTSGSYTLTFKTSYVGGSTVVLPQGQTIIAICDGQNVYNAQTASSSTLQSLTLGNGSASAPSLNFLGDTSTGLYLAATAQLAFAVGGVSAGELTSTGLFLPVGINGGAF